MSHCCDHHHADAASTGRATLTVGEIGRDPRALDVLKQAGINHCCGAHLTLAEAAAAAGVQLPPLLARLEAAAPTTPWVQAPKPAVLETIAPSHHTVVDVREQLARGEEPFARIMDAVTSLAPGHAVMLRVPFEPAPLYHVLDRRGLTHWTERRAVDDWVVWFWPTRAPEPVVLDVRGLEPPEPMVRILERIDTLAADGVLDVIHDRQPIFLYPQLDARGFAYEAQEEGPGRVHIRIRRREAAA
jgi:uncharacterized protein (DUF2249 family)